MNSYTLADSLLSTITDRTSIVFDCEYRSTDIWIWNKFCVSLTWWLFEDLESVNCWKPTLFTIEIVELKARVNWNVCLFTKFPFYFIFGVRVKWNQMSNQLSHPRFSDNFKSARFDVKQFVYAHTETRSKHFDLFRESQTFFEPGFRFRGLFQSNLADTIVRMQLNLRCFIWCFASHDDTVARENILCSVFIFYYY